MSLLIKKVTITVTRSSAGGYDQFGKMTAPTTSIITMQANVFPITEEELQFFPEGTRLEAAWKVRTSVPLLQNSVNQKADVVEIAGKKYQVIRCGDWSTQVTPVAIPKFYKSAVRLLEEQV